MMNTGDMGWGFSGMWFGSSMMFLGLALTVVLIIFLVKWLGGGDGLSLETDDRSLRILKDRYAAGEIDKVEYEEKREALFH